MFILRSDPLHWLHKHDSFHKHDRSCTTQCRCHPLPTRSMGISHYNLISHYMYNLISSVVLCATPVALDHIERQVVKVAALEAGFAPQPLDHHLQPQPIRAPQNSSYDGHCLCAYPQSDLVAVVDLVVVAEVDWDDKQSLRGLRPRGSSCGGDYFVFSPLV